MSLLAFPSVSDTYLTVSFLALMKQKIVATTVLCISVGKRPNGLETNVIIKT
jgi:hypothetical protein